MAQYAIIFQVLAAGLVIFFLVLTWLNTKTWRWVHVTFMFLVFVATCVFLFYAAQVHKTRTAWIKYHDEKERQLAETIEQLERVTRGDPPSVSSLREQLGRAILDRGRVWRQVTPTFGAQSVQISTAPPAFGDPDDPNAPPPPPAENHNLKPKDILYAFGEVRTADGLILPAGYIGEFQVTEATDTTATLVNTMPLSPQQRQIGRAAQTWTLYEVMPVDGHDWFSDLEQSLADNDREHNRILQQTFQDLPEPVRQSYLRDGQPAEDNDPPENVWVELRFLQTHRVAVDAPAAEIDLEPFNPEGQAQHQSLRRTPPGGDPEPVEFGPGPTQINTGLFDQQTAQSLVDQGIAQVERRIYRRRLTDYERQFHSLHQRMVDLNNRLKLLNDDHQAIQAATEKANNQSALLTEYQNKLNADIEKAEHELAELSKYADALAAKLNQTQAELSALYRSNRQIGQELAETSARLTEEIESRARAATALNR